MNRQVLSFYISLSAKAKTKIHLYTAAVKKSEGANVWCFLPYFSERGKRKDIAEIYEIVCDLSPPPYTRHEAGAPFVCIYFVWANTLPFLIFIWNPHRNSSIIWFKFVQTTEKRMPGRDLAGNYFWAHDHNKLVWSGRCWSHRIPFTLMKNSWVLLWIFHLNADSCFCHSLSPPRLPHISKPIKTEKGRKRKSNSL